MSREIFRGKFPILGVNISALDYGYVLKQIIAAAKSKQPLLVACLPVHGIMTGFFDLIHRYRLNAFDIVAPDGQPVRWALNLVHKIGLRDRVYGPELMLRVCDIAQQEKLSVFIYGSFPEVLTKLAVAIKSRYPDLVIAGTKSTPYRIISVEERQGIIEEIKKSNAGILFVGLGCPSQEIWAYEYKNLLNMPIIAVGAAFDFISGSKPQAPAWMQNYGLEWFFRLISEPKRLWKRYIFLNPLFIILIVLQVLHITNFDPARTIKPAHDLMFG